MAIKVFIVDESVHQRDILKRLLLAGDYEIEIIGEAATGVNAMLLIEDNIPDIIFLELNKYSQMRPLDVIRGLLSFDPNIRMIICSSSRDRDLLVELHEKHSLDDIIEKPFEHDKLMKVLRDVIRYT